MNFIEEIASYVQKYAPKYNIDVCSPIIAQAILESGHGKSELAVNANNYFGLKYKSGRCPSASGVYYKIGSEQNPDGSYADSMMKWCRFDDMESCVVGYFDFINIPRYENLKNVSNPDTYIENIKNDGYATSIKYIDNLKRVVKEYNLTKYDEVKRMKTIALDAGHGYYTSGKRCMKSIDPNETREWYLNDRISDIVEKMLGDYDCRVVRVGDTTGQKDISLSQRVTTANNINADIYISVHHNAGARGTKSGGTVVFYYSNNAERKKQAERLYNDIVAQTGLVGNRSSKVIKKGYYVIKHTKMPAFLVENGFMDSINDTPIILTDYHAEKTALGILHFLVNELGLKKTGKEEITIPEDEGVDEPVDTLYRVQVGAYKKKENAIAMLQKLENAGFKGIVVQKK